MPAVSKAQQRFFGYLDSHPEEAKKRGVDMSHEQIREFAATKRTGLPERAKDGQAKVGRKYYGE